MRKLIITFMKLPLLNVLSDSSTTTHDPIILADEITNGGFGGTRRTLPIVIDANEDEIYKLVDAKKFHEVFKQFMDPTQGKELLRKYKNTISEEGDSIVDRILKCDLKYDYNHNRFTWKTDGGPELIGLCIDKGIESKLKYLDKKDTKIIERIQSSARKINEDERLELLKEMHILDDDQSPSPTFSL